MKADVAALRFRGRMCAVVLLALFCAGCQLFGGNPTQENRDRLYARLEEFSQIPPREQLTDQPYIRGRALIITKKQVPPVTMIADPASWGADNAEGLMAEAPEQVETVMVLNYSREKAGTYQIVGAKGEVDAYREICELILIDPSIPAVIHRKTFRASDPPSAKSIDIGRQATVVTSVDLTTVRKYITDLPRR
jgi:hypothetical protein